MNRRRMLTAAAALPCIAAPALVLADTTDPAVTAYKAWRAAHDAWIAFLGAHDDWDTPEGEALRGRQWAARLALSDSVASTPAGLLCQIRFAFSVFGEPISDAVSVEDPANFKFLGWADDHEGRFMRSLLAGAERMAG